jgi:2-keto-3-deoxy-L-rhamnonate aldolase RhmA
MGIPADYRNPKMWANFERVAKACRANGKAMGVGGARGDFGLQRDLIELGVRYMTTGSDVSYLMAAARSEVASLRNLKL